MSSALDRLEPTSRTTLHRLPARGSHARADVYRILDEGLVCHVGFVAEQQPYVIPTIYARIGDRLYVHGSAASRMLRTLAGGIEICVTVTLLDGLVLARSAFHHSVNYRSVVVLGRALPVFDAEERLTALEALVEHVMAGRWNAVRSPSAKELKATLVLALPLTEASAKVRSGPPLDDEEDYAVPVWAGVLPLRTVALTPVADVHGESERPLPDHVIGYTRRLARGIDATDIQGCRGEERHVRTERVS